MRKTILVDLMLPKLNGLDFLQMVRTTSHIPVIVMGSKL